jgi:DNA-directed RNA polymerase subunit RPC12/RpoP
MGQVINFRPTYAPHATPSQALYRCARCGADLWNILADGRVRCADCEEECPMRTFRESDATNRS